MIVVCNVVIFLANDCFQVLQHGMDIRHLEVAKHFQAIRMII